MDPTKKCVALYDLPKEIVMKILTPQRVNDLDRVLYTSKYHTYVAACTICDVCNKSCFGFVVCENYNRISDYMKLFNVTYTCLECCTKCIDCKIRSCSDNVCSKKCAGCEDTCCDKCGEICHECSKFYCRKCRQEKDTCTTKKCYICGKSELEQCCKCGKSVCLNHFNDCPARCGIYCKNCTHYCGGC
jgi:hypothetical protein